MAGDTVLVQSAYLDQLRTAISKASIGIGSGTSVPGCDFSRAPEVQRAWNALYRRWDENQHKIADNLHRIETAVIAIRDAFLQCDSALASNLTGPT